MNVHGSMRQSGTVGSVFVERWRRLREPLDTDAFLVYSYEDADPQSLHYFTDLVEGTLLLGTSFGNSTLELPAQLRIQNIAQPVTQDVDEQD